MSPNSRSVKELSVGALLLRHITTSIFLYFYIFLTTECRQYRVSAITIAIDGVDWPEKKRYNYHIIHCVKSIQIRSFFWSVFSCIRTDTPDLSVFSPNADIYGPDTFHTVIVIINSSNSIVHIFL